MAHPMRKNAPDYMRQHIEAVERMQEKVTARLDDIPPLVRGESYKVLFDLGLALNNLHHGLTVTKEVIED